MITIDIFIEVLKIVATVAVLFVWSVRYDNIKKEFREYGLPRWFRDVIGILKISFTFMLHSSTAVVVVIGSGGISLLMLGAMLTHLKMKSPFKKYIASVTMFSISTYILINTI
tara:strand:+ start:445 stop:783 length:339 start_codon:yes stop_codon:yes gene_type:complete